MKLAEAQARAMASRDKLDHNVTRDFNARLRGAGYRARARPRTFRPAITRWRKHSPAGANSAPHRQNMLLNGATRMGIAAVYAPKSKYKVFWALILAQPDERRG